MAYRGVALGNDGNVNTTNTTCTYTIPATVQAGDILYVTASTNFDSTDSATIANTGTAISWSVISTDHAVSSGNNNLCYLWQGVALSDSAGQTVTVTWSPSGGRSIGILLAVSGDTTTGATFAHNEFSTSTISFAAVTATAGADILAMVDMRAASTTKPTIATAPTGFTKDGESQSAYSSSAQFTHTAFHEANVSAGSITPSNVTANETVNGHAYTIMIPAASTNLNDIKLGTGNVGLDRGTSAVSAAYLGTGKVWP